MDRPVCQNCKRGGYFYNLDLGDATALYCRFCSWCSGPKPKSMSDVACDLDAVASSWDATSYLQNTDLRKRWEVKAPVLHQRDAEGLGGAKRRTDDNLRHIFG